MSTQQQIFTGWLRNLPSAKPASITAWARENVRLPGSAKSEQFNPDITPWIVDPLEDFLQGIRSSTFVKPVQAGGSTAGEVVMDFIIATQTGGDFQYNWQSDESAEARFEKRIDPILKACAAVMRRAPANVDKWKNGLIIFPHLNFIVQGVRTAKNVASDSIRFQINEEMHDVEGGWAHGRHEQATGRLTAYSASSFQMNISNAGKENTELHKLWLAGTQQRWSVKCPGCGEYHVMRCEWEDQHPELGGLRYDSEGCKRPDGTFNYAKLEKTIRYQFPCGHEIKDDAQIRRKLSQSGKYTDPVEGSNLLERSRTLEAVSVDYIPWLSLIKQKHAAYLSFRNGDRKAWFDYLRERECIFVNENDRPSAMRVTLSKDVKKNRAGIIDRDVRFTGADFQQGKKIKNELTHSWELTADFKRDELTGKLRVLIVSEGKISTDANFVDRMKELELIPSCVACDSSWDSQRIYQLCMTHGYYALKYENLGSSYGGHPDKSRKIYSPPKPLHAMINQPSKFDYVRTKEGMIPDPQEPMFMRFSQFEALSLVRWLRTSDTVSFEVPEDASEDFKKQIDAWHYDGKKNKSGIMEYKWRKLSDDDHLLMCLCQIAIMAADAGMIGAVAMEDESDSKEK